MLINHLIKFIKFIIAKMVYYVSNLDDTHIRDDKDRYLVRLKKILSNINLTLIKLKFNRKGDILLC